MVPFGPLAGVGVALWAALGAQDSGDTVPLELRDSVLRIKATVNGKGPFTFVFDTGAAMTVLKPETAGKAGLAVAEGRVTEVDTLAAGRAVAKKVRIAVREIPPADHPDCDGILGATFISRFVSTIDYSARTLKLVPADPAPATLGFSYRTIPDDLANEVGLEGGVEVRAVAVGGPAARGGLRKGDLIREVNGRRIETADQYRALLGSIRPGDAVPIKVVRDRKDLEIKLTAAAPP
jgi:C-terminal processing protease CtpA/Prc